MMSQVTGLTTNRSNLTRNKRIFAKSQSFLAESLELSFFFLIFAQSLFLKLMPRAEADGWRPNIGRRYLYALSFDE